MHQTIHPQPLGGQQLRRLRRLREANDNAVHKEHLKQRGGVSTSLYDAQQAVDPIASRTVDAIVEERLQNKGNSSTSARLRDKVTAARRGAQTERSERPGDESRQPERTKSTRKIVAVRRRGGNQDEKSNSRQRMGKLEAEWIEKQLQYKTRVATLEKEYRTAWQGFFASAGTSTSSSGFVSLAEVNKMLEEMDTLRVEDVRKMKHQLTKLSSKLRDVQAKVEEIANGDQFFSELQERIDVMEAALAQFQLDQLQHFEGHMLKEKVIEKELSAFMEKMEGWENETPSRLSRGGASSAYLGPRMTRLSTKSSSNLHTEKPNSNNGGESVNCSNKNREEDRTVREGTPDEIGMMNRLVEEKKRVIQDWKARKEEDRQHIISCGFDADGTDNLDRDGTPETRDISSSGHSDRAKLKSREKTERLLEQWKREKKQKEVEKEQRRRELQKKRDAVEAKRKQEQLDAKQKIILYKMQKEQEAMMLDRTVNRLCTNDDLSLGPVPISSPTSNEDLVERSRIAIEYAKAKRLRLQQIEERKQRQQQLPPRPETKTTDEHASPVPKQAMVFNATEASKARGLSKEEIRRKERRRERQSAHDAYIPGKKAIPDVKFKSFGHIPIQPRAIPAWRKNI
ncbi:hypothetical protein PInf_025805 [Phytophthora infestans]|nr:hypothetical protein PInf_025805 [Phytophthora infestans]